MSDLHTRMYGFRSIAVHKILSSIIYVFVIGWNTASVFWRAQDGHNPSQSVEQYSCCNSPPKWQMEIRLVLQKVCLAFNERLIIYFAVGVQGLYEPHFKHIGIIIQAILVGAAYVKCIKLFSRLCSVFVGCFRTSIGRPTFNALLHNVMFGFKNSSININNRLVLIAHDSCTSIWFFIYLLLCYLFLVAIC